MQFPFFEPTRTHHIFINPNTNCVHILMPVVNGKEIGVDNTCKATQVIEDFWGLNEDSQTEVLHELREYESALLLDIRLLEMDSPIKSAKQERLAQITVYISAIEEALDTTVLDILDEEAEYPEALQDIMRNSNENVHSMVLRPPVLDEILHFVSPVFAMNRDGPSILYDSLITGFQGVTPLSDAKMRFIAAVLPVVATTPGTFSDVQRVLTEQTQTQLHTEVDFYHNTSGQQLTQADVDTAIGYDGETPVTTEEYVKALLSVCAPLLFAYVSESPFQTRQDTDELSILTQFFLAHVNIHCQSKGISSANFASVLDDNKMLCDELVATVLAHDTNIEDAVLAWINNHHQTLGMSRELIPGDKAQIKKQFTENYAQIELSEHFDEFLLLDNQKQGSFISYHGSICVNLAQFLRAAIPEHAPEQLEKIDEDFKTVNPEDITVNNNGVYATVELSIESLLNKIPDDAQLQTLLDKLTPTQQAEIAATPPFKLRKVPYLADHVVKGEQNQAEELLIANTDVPLLLHKHCFTDYSGRTFNCSAYEYAYWAQDWHMCRMLEAFMDDATKAVILERCEAIEAHGLNYTQDGIAKNSKHFDFTALKQAQSDYLEKRKLVINSNLRSDWDELITLWYKIGLAQRDVPVYVAHEYCRPDRPLIPLPTFKEKSLPRFLVVYNQATRESIPWFPLDLPDTPRLGYDFVMRRDSFELGAEGYPIFKNMAPNITREHQAICELEKASKAETLKSLQNLISPTQAPAP